MRTKLKKILNYESIQFDENSKKPPIAPKRYTHELVEEDYAIRLADFIYENGLIEITHVLSRKDGWLVCPTDGLIESELTYLGRCSFDGDMFTCNFNGEVQIFKGHVNSGYYKLTIR